MWWIRALRWVVGLAFLLSLGLTAARVGAEPPESDDESMLGVIYPPVQAVGDEFLSGAQAFDRSIQAALPLGKSLAGDRVDELPLPIGLMFSYNHQWDTLNISRLEVSLDGSGEIPVPSSWISDIHASTNSYSLVLDAWLLPFWNIYGVVGYSEGTAKIDIKITEQLQGSFEQAYDVVTYGGGTVLTAGWREIFVVANATWTTQEVNLLDSHVNAFLAAPRIGWQTSIGATAVSVWTGANYLHISKHQYGRLDLEVPVIGAVDITYDLDIHEVGAWNAALGGRASLGKRFDFVVDAGLGVRKSIMTSVAVRF